MTGYTKLFGSILASTIWEESKETRVCWITMLAMADKFGVVSASIPGLATLARLTIEETEKAVEKLSAPDPYSRTKDFDGRRIEKCDGGWLILNHAKYRQKINDDERRDYLAEAQRRSRQKRKELTVNNVNNVNSCQQLSKMSTQAEAYAEAEAKNKEQELATTENSGEPDKPKTQQQSDAPKKRDRPDYPPEFEQFWNNYPKRNGRLVGKKKCLDIWKRNRLSEEKDNVLLATANYAKCQQSQNGYAKDPERFLSSRFWEDWIESVTDEELANHAKQTETKQSTGPRLPTYWERKFYDPHTGGPANTGVWPAGYGPNGPLDGNIHPDDAAAIAEEQRRDREWAEKRVSMMNNKPAVDRAENL